MHKTLIEKLKDESSSALNLLTVSKNFELKNNLESFAEKENKYQEEIKKLNITIKDQKNEINYLKENLFERENRISELTVVDGGFEAMRNMTGLLESLNNVILESANEKKKQQNAIVEISGFINATSSKTIPPKTKSEHVQTDWTLKNDLLTLPFYKEPKLSFHSFLNLEPGNIEIFLKDVKLIFTECLLTYKPISSFLDHFSLKILNKFRNPTDTRKALYTICIQIKASNEV